MNNKLPLILASGIVGYSLFEYLLPPLCIKIEIKKPFFVLSGTALCIYFAKKNV
jgi:hypothetical protein